MMDVSANVEQIVIYPPNRPFERELFPSKLPVMYQYLLFMDVNNKGKFIVGCSNIAGSYWEGSLFHYKDGTSAIENNYSNYFISDSSMSDAKFFTEERVLLAEDCGGLKLLKISENDNAPFKCEIAYDKVDRIEKIAKWDNTYNLITCSDNSIHTWTLTDEISSNPVHEFRHYHTEPITDIDTKKDDDEIFGSVSIDRRAVMWDLRQTIKPASILYSNEFGALTAICWSQSNPDYVVVGSEGGDIYLLDIRQPKEFLSVAHGFDSRIHRLQFDHGSKIAVAGDTQEFLVLNNNKSTLSPIYRNRVHKGMVRGFSWYEDMLFTCAFDGKVLRHTIADTF